MEKVREKRTQQINAVVVELVPSFGARIIVTIALMVPFPTSILFLSAAAAVASIAVWSSSVSISVATVSGSYRLTVTTGEAS